MRPVRSRIALGTVVLLVGGLAYAGQPAAAAGPAAGPTHRATLVDQVVRARGQGSAPIATGPAAARTAEVPAQSGSVAPAVASATQGTFVGITPARLMDTRPGHHTVDGLYAGGNPFGPGSIGVIQVAGRGGVPWSASAVVLNITVTGATQSTFVTVYPGQSLRPNTSNVNVAPGQTVAVASTVGLGQNFDGSSNHTISVYNKAGSPQIIIDVTGYYQGNGVTQGGTFHPQTPIRVLDTRTPPHAILAGHYDWIDLSIPQTSAVAINITVTGAAAAGYVSVWPGSGPHAPATSTVNFGRHQSVANMAVVGTAADPTSVPAGAPAFSVGVGGTGSVNVIVDVVGWYSTDTALDGGGLRFHATVPQRIVDTRSGIGIPAPLGPAAKAAVTTPGAVGDVDTEALVANLTGLGDASATYLSVYPGPDVPNASSLNLAAHGVGSNMVMTGLAADGSRTFGVFNAAGTAQVITDVVGYFDAAPVASVSLGSSLSTVAYDHAVTLTATVAANGGPAPAGSIAFVDETDGVVLAELPVTGTTAAITTAALTAGAHQLVAQYTPTGLFVPSMSTPVALTVTAPAAAYSTDYQQDPLHDGFDAGSTITSTLHQAWTQRFANGDSLSAPIVADGRVFTVVHGAVVGQESSLYALSLTTGAILWGPIDVAGSSSTAALTYDGLTVFTVSDDGLLAAYSATDGSLVWSHQLAFLADVWAAPTAWDGVVYVVAGGYFTFWAVSEVDGSILWQGNAGNDKQAAPAVDASGVYLGDVCPLQEVYTLTGALRWQPPVSACQNNGQTAALHAGKEYTRDETTGLPGSIISTSTGSSLGTYSADRVPAFDANNGYFLTGGTLTATSAAGAHLWDFTGDGQLVSAPVVANGLVFVESALGTVFAVDVTTGLSVWSGSAGDAFGLVRESSLNHVPGLALSGTTLVVDSLSVAPPPGVSQDSATLTAFTN